MYNVIKNTLVDSYQVRLHCSTDNDNDNKLTISQRLKRP